MKFVNYIKKWASLGYNAAVEQNGNVLSYLMLDKESDAIASYIAENVEFNSPIIIRGDKENYCIVCMVAALKSGHPYIFVPDWFPEKKLTDILTVSKSKLILSTSDSIDFTVNVPVILGNELKAIANSGKFVSSECETKENETAAIFFTSGSTGVPKGVKIPLSAIEDMEKWWSELFYRGIDAPKILNFSSYAFVASLQTVYSFMIGFGGCLYAVDHNVSSDYQAMLDLILKTKPNYLDCTPSFATLCMQNAEFGSDCLPEMKIISVGGEPLNEKTAKAIQERFYKAELINGYGATEMTAGPIACIITPEMVSKGGSMPIGYAAKGTRAYAVDDNRNPLPFNQQGELVIESKMVSDGYVNDDVRNENQFFVASDGLRGYYTGDLVKILPDGEIIYLGRTNNMVKIGGYRVEMEEIELHLRRVAGVKDCVVVPVYQDEHAIMTAAYVIMEDGQSAGLPTFVRIKKDLKALLPSYMIPQKLFFVDSFPKNSNGKTDRKQLTDKCREN